MNLKVCLRFVFVFGTLYPRVAYASEMYWQVKDLVDKADIIAKVYVKHLDYKKNKGRLPLLENRDLYEWRLLKQ